MEQKIKFLLTESGFRLIKRNATYDKNNNNKQTGLQILFRWCLNMEQAHKREGHTPFEHFVRFVMDQLKWRMLL